MTLDWEFTISSLLLLANCEGIFPAIYLRGPSHQLGYRTHLHSEAMVSLHWFPPQHNLLRNASNRLSICPVAEAFAGLPSTWTRKRER
ncbi:hypothetical protein K470DRAFT_260541 [Piedraia hortae CBS 480.64]|uniref:Secreted protein n=1 Tax=Piedraia hortae CBS 480.64 TaxID=1314780 RepID=A0A6A7BSL4_9PEZI|nr:hypothetical protein K470DRAFT_260541 [Piedraia hortae CBS 480.64]